VRQLTNNAVVVDDNSNPEFLTDDVEMINCEELMSGKSYPSICLSITNIKVTDYLK